VGTGSPTTGLYKFSVGAFWVVDIYFLVVAKTFLDVYSMGVLIEAVHMNLGLTYCALASRTVSPHLVSNWWAFAWIHVHRGYWVENPPRGWLQGHAGTHLGCWWLVNAAFAVLVPVDIRKGPSHGLCLAISPACPC